MKKQISNFIFVYSECTTLNKYNINVLIIIIIIIIVIIIIIIIIIVIILTDYWIALSMFAVFRFRPY